MNFSILGKCVRVTAGWFLLKFILGTVVAFLTPRWMIISEGGVTFQWQAYILGAGALIVLWAISDIRPEYNRRSPNTRRSSRHGTTNR